MAWKAWWDQATHREGMKELQRGRKQGCGREKGERREERGRERRGEEERGGEREKEILIESMAMLASFPFPHFIPSYRIVLPTCRVLLPPKFSTNPLGMLKPTKKTSTIHHCLYVTLKSADTQQCSHSTVKY